jgi:hypothetical protein
VPLVRPLGLSDIGELRALLDRPDFITLLKKAG